MVTYSFHNIANNAGIVQAVEDNKSKKTVVMVVVVTGVRWYMKRTRFHFKVN